MLGFIKTLTSARKSTIIGITAGVLLLALVAVISYPFGDSGRLPAFYSIEAQLAESRMYPLGPATREILFGRSLLDTTFVLDANYPDLYPIDVYHDASGEVRAIKVVAEEPRQDIPENAKLGYLMLKLSHFGMMTSWVHVKACPTTQPAKSAEHSTVNGLDQYIWSEQVGGFRVQYISVGTAPSRRLILIIIDPSWHT